MQDASAPPASVSLSTIFGRTLKSTRVVDRTRSICFDRNYAIGRTRIATPLCRRKRSAQSPSRSSHRSGRDGQRNRCTQQRASSAKRWRARTAIASSVEPHAARSATCDCRSAVVLAVVDRPPRSSPNETADVSSATACRISQPCKSSWGRRPRRVPPAKTAVVTPRISG